jgi:hypothetical protein
LVTSEKLWSISRGNCDRTHFIGDTNHFYSSVAKEVEDAYMSIEVLRIIKVRANLEPAFREQLMRSPMNFLQEYDLTEEEKRQIILPNFGWLFENKLAAMAYPESEDAFTLLYRNQGCTQPF